jgi:hypothetical protein
MPSLNNWSAGSYSDGSQYLLGFVKGHHELRDGGFVQTSRVKGRIGNTVVTESGSHYHLEVPMGFDPVGNADPQNQRLDDRAMTLKARFLAKIPEINSADPGPSQANKA